MTPFLLDHELAMLTHPLRQASARRRHLAKLGVPFSVRPDGQPIVMRDAMQPRATGPDDINLAGLKAHLKRGLRRG